jgi:hypothetical protein
MTHIAINQHVFFDRVNEMVKSLNNQKDNCNDPLMISRIEGYEQGMQYMSRLIINNAEPVITKELPFNGFGFTIRND